MNVSFIGSGNLAWHLAPAFDNLGYVVREVYSRNTKNAGKLTERLYQAEVAGSLDFSQSTSKLFVIAVSDDAIEEVVQEIALPDEAILIHTSGSRRLSSLANAATEHTGVFYPLQSFSKDRPVDFKKVPVFIECSDGEVEKCLTNIARQLTTRFKKLDSVQRNALHVAAVFASNFPNHMLTIARSVMKNNKLEFDWLKPLITETITKSIDNGPEKSQTGPAVRGDMEILDQHMEFLKKEKELAKIYKLISQHIIDAHS
jgi:predicted short-subunit dehydrogenase-like oxidoreductase (DUF2520 family)